MDEFAFGRNRHIGAEHSLSSEKVPSFACSLLNYHYLIRFANFAVVALKGSMEEVTEMLTGDARQVDWETVTLGTNYIKPNYPGRSSHICNAGFLVHESARGRGIGRVLGELYIELAPMLVSHTRKLACRICRCHYVSLLIKVVSN